MANFIIANGVAAYDKQVTLLFTYLGAECHQMPKKNQRSQTRLGKNIDIRPVMIGKCKKWMLR